MNIKENKIRWLSKKHREYEKDSKYGCFSVGRSKQEIFNDLKEFAKEHPNERIYYYVHPVRPNKENYRPEYMMEIELLDDGGIYIMPFWSQYQ